MRKLTPLALATAALFSTPALAQRGLPPADALAVSWQRICATAQNGTLLLVRCGETAASTDPMADYIAATGQRLDEIPGQGRIASRDFTGLNTSTFADLAGNPVTVAFGQNQFGGLSLNAEDELAPQLSLFFSADVGRVKRRRGVNEAAFDADTSSFTAGLNWQASPSWLLGIAANHTRENLDFSLSQGSADTRFTGLIATASHPYAGSWSLDGYAGYQRGRYDLLRSIHYVLPTGSGSVTVDGSAFANPDATRTFQGVTTTGNWSKNGWDRTLTFGVDGSKTKIDPYTEGGGVGLALVVPGRAVKTFRGLADFSISRTISRDWGVWQPSLRVGWRQEFSNERRSVTLRLAQDPVNNPITFDTEDPDRGWGEVAVGSVFTFTKGRSGFIQYQQRFAHAYLQERIFAVGFRIEL